MLLQCNYIYSKNNQHEFFLVEKDIVFFFSPPRSYQLYRPRWSNIRMKIIHHIFQMSILCQLRYKFYNSSGRYLQNFTFSLDKLGYKLTPKFTICDFSLKFANTIFFLKTLPQLIFSGGPFSTVFPRVFLPNGNFMKAFFCEEF